MRHTSNGNGDYKYIRLRHGRASVGPKRVRLALNIALDETGIEALSNYPLSILNYPLKQ